MRIPRTLLDRWVGVVYPARRYRCQQFGCGWSGLRFGRSELAGKPDVPRGT